MSTLTGLRAALTAARPTLTGEQQDAADALLAALTDYSNEIVREQDADPTALPWAARALAVARAVLREAGE